MTDPRTSESAGRALSAAEADDSLTVLTRHALTVRTGAATAPTSVTVANGPVLLHINWEGGGEGRTSNPVVDSHLLVSIPDEQGSTSHNGSNGDNGTQTATFTLIAETVGVFYRSSEPGAAPFIAEGDPVRAGQQVAIVEAMKLMIPITATREGVVAEFLVEDGAAIEHGQPLIVFEALR